MSLASWKEEFYPVPANACFKSKAIEHSIRKWIGLRPENLAKHDLTVSRGTISDGYGYFMEIRDKNCALCYYHASSSCSTCPIVKVTGKQCLDEYLTFIGLNDPEPMISLLEKTHEF